MDEYEQLRKKIMHDPDTKFGFVVYRCTYQSDEDWNKFMEYLDTHTKWQLERRGVGDLYSRLDWAVQSDPDLEDASKKEVRKRFRQWINQNPSQGFFSTARYHACVMVDDVNVEWVVRKRPVPSDQHESNDILSVTLVSKNYEGHRDPSMSSDYEDDEDEDDEFEDFDPSTFDPSKPAPEMTDEQEAKALRREDKEAKRKDKISCELVGISHLVPSAFSLLDGAGWHSIADDRMLREGNF